MGGTDLPSNLVNLSVEDHAEAHRLLWEQYGRHEDLVAWKGLSALISQEEMHIEKARLGGKNNKGKAKSEETKKKISESLKGRKCPAVSESNKRRKTERKEK